MEDVDDDWFDRRLHRPFREGEQAIFLDGNNSTRTHTWTHLSPKWENSGTACCDAMMNGTPRSAPIAQELAISACETPSI